MFLVKSQLLTSEAISENILVKVVDGVSLLSNYVVEAVCRVGVDQAVTDPFSGFDAKERISTASRKIRSRLTSQKVR